MKHTLATLFAITIAFGSVHLNAEEKKPMPRGRPTVREARAFIEGAEARLLELQNESRRTPGIA